MFNWFPGDPLPDNLDGDYRPDPNPKGKAMTEHVERKRVEIMPGGVLVRFTKNANPYNAGEVAGFNQESADHLVKVLKVGEVVTRDLKTGEYLSAGEAAPVPHPASAKPAIDELAELDKQYNVNDLKALAEEAEIEIPKEIKTKAALLKFLHEKGAFNGGSDTGSSEDDKTGSDEDTGAGGSSDE